jgi:hypothetical protein
MIVLLSLAAYVFKRNFFQGPQNKRHCVSCRHVATCLQDMLQKHLSFVTSEEMHFLVRSRHFFVLKECLRSSNLSQHSERIYGLSTRITPCTSLTSMSFSHLCIDTAMYDDCIDASQPVRTGRESNLRIRLRRAVYLPATLIAP